MQLVHAADRAAGRLYDALAQPARRERNVLIALAAYTALWTIYGTVSKGSQGLHYDMVELVAWSRDLAFGYLKHPPLGAWLVAVWFAVFQVAEWSYYLLAMLMPSIALWIVWRLSADYLEIEKRIAGLALLMLVPFFNFHALKFNVNTALIPLWAATTFFFLRSYITRSALYAALAGVVAAASMLGKYWSIFLLAGLALAALIDSRRGDYFKSAAPWITVVAGVLVLTPHVIWLVQNDFAPFTYATSIHGAKPIATTAFGALGYLAGSFGYAAIPGLVVLAIARPRGAALADILWPVERERRLVAAAFWGPFLLPAVGAIATGTEINSLWSISAWALLPVLLLSSPEVRLTVNHARHIVAAALVVPLIMLAAAPFIAAQVHRAGTNPGQAHYALLAEHVERLWREATDRPLVWVGGDEGLAFGVSAYATAHPRAMAVRPNVAAEEVLKTGVTFVCFAEDQGCVQNIQRNLERNPRLIYLRGRELTLRRDYFGAVGRPQKYRIILAGPR